MSNIWISSDHHQNHANIIRYSNRPFSSVEEMEEGLIANHNSLVKPNDTFFHLGDFAFAGTDVIRRILKRMNGKKIFLKGNHDKEHNFTGLVDDFRADWFGKLGNLSVHMYHYPISSWNWAFHGSVHLHGHSHGTTNSDGLLRWDVGVDCFNMFPVGIDELEKLVKERKELLLETGVELDSARVRPGRMKQGEEA